MLKNLAISLALASAAITAQAQQADTSGTYMGASLGRSSASLKDVTWPVGTSGIDTKDENDTGWRIFGGYQFNQYGAIELGYMNIGEISRTLTFTAPVVIAGTSLTGKYEGDGFVADVVGTIPLSEQFALLGRIGAMYSNVKNTYSTNNAALTAALVAAGTDMNPEHSEWNGRLGIGAQFNFSKSVGARVEWEKTYAIGDKDKTGEGDVGFLSIGLRVKF